MADNKPDAKTIAEGIRIAQDKKEDETAMAGCLGCLGIFVLAVILAIAIYGC